MDKISKEISDEAAEMASFQAEHIEKFAAAFIKETGLDPTKIKMVQQSLDNGFGYKVWFEPFPKESEIEMYRIRAETAGSRAENAEARAEKAEAMLKNVFFVSAKFYSRLNKTSKDGSQLENELQRFAKYYAEWIQENEDEHA